MTLSDDKILNDVRSWLSTRLGCLPGRRESNLGRFRYCIVRDRDDLQLNYNTLVKNMDIHASSGCLFIFPRIPCTNDLSIRDIFKILANSLITLKDIEFSITENGIIHQGNILRLHCPVTGQLVDYHDFEYVAFCPQANNESDELYNPSLEAPYPSVNFTSDVFGFSLFVRDICVQHTGCAPYEISDKAARDQVFDRASQLWQRLAINTMREYSSRTNADLICPLHINSTKTHWISSHADSSFASFDTGLYLQEMPKSYLPRIIKQWNQWFSHKTYIDYSHINTQEIQYIPANHPLIRVD